MSNEAFEHWFNEDTNLSGNKKALSRLAFEAGQSASSARIAELELIVEGMYARNDGMHKQLAELESDARVMAAKYREAQNG